MLNEQFPTDILKMRGLQFAARVLSEIEDAELSRSPSLIIGGAQRCGKSTLAALISKNQKMFQFGTDFARDNFYGELEGKEKKWAASFVFKKVLALFSQGIIAEGSAFTDVARSVPIWARKEPRDIPVFILGSTSDYRAKYDAMLSFREENPCWTSKSLSNPELLELAHHITERSFTNKELCLEHGFTYCDIDPHNFDRDIKTVASEIENSLSSSVFD